MNIRALLCATSAVVAVASSAQAAGWDTPVAFEIAPQALDSALLTYSQQSGIQVLSASDVVLNKRAKGVRGVTRPDDALAALLSGTNLTYRRSGEKTAAIVPVRAALQTVADVTPRAATSAAPSASQPVADGGRLEEIVVTAQRRGENLQDVPISVNAFAAEQLKTLGASSSEDLSLIPNVVYNPGVGGGQITIRGIGGLNSGGEEPANAIYIDGVYQFATTANLFQFNAIERLEVLKGPQGTLFGRNTAGGVIQVITRDPDDTPALEAQVGYANYQTTQGNIYVNAPVTDSVAVNVAAYGLEQNEGWGRNLFTGEDVHTGYSWGVRGKAKWEAASGKTDVVLSAIYNKDKPIASGSGTFAAGTRDMLGGVSQGLFNTNSELEEERTAEQTQFAGTVHHDMGFARLTSISAYGRTAARIYADGDLTPAPILIGDISGLYRNFSQEFQLQSPEDSRLQWILGAFYLDGDSPFQYTFDGLAFGGATISFNTLIETRSYAAFGQASYPVTNNTTLTLGLRYTSDWRRLTALGNSSVAEDKKPTWRLAVDHKISEDVLTYASYSRGFKSGVFNSSSPTKPAADATTLDAYEVGLKMELFDHRLRVNTAAFYYDYKDVQIQLIELTRYFVNGGDARSYGLDVDVTAEPVENLTLTGGLSLLSTEFTDYDPSKPLPPCYAAPPAPQGGLIVGACSPVGNELPFSPEFTLSLGMNYKIETSVGRFDLAGAYSHNSGYYTDPSNFEPTKTPDFDLVNASVTWTSPGETFDVTLWGKNLLDEHVVGSSDVSGVGAIVYPMAPQTYGLALGMKF